MALPAFCSSNANNGPVPFTAQPLINSIIKVQHTILIAISLSKIPKN
jgi:hypothetical protein